MEAIEALETLIDETQRQIEKFRTLPTVEDPALQHARYKNLHELTFKLVGLQERYQEMQRPIQDVQMDVLNLSERLANETGE